MQTKHDSQNRILLFVSTYGFDCGFVQRGRPDCIPIEAGAARRSEDEILYPLRDDTGDNISADNAYWGELSAMYWLWRNYRFQEGDIVGFCHYRKYITLSDSKIRRFIDRHKDGWIVTYPKKYGCGGEHAGDVAVLRDVLRERYPEYYASWTKLYDNGGGCLGYNLYFGELFYTSEREFRSYCEFLFGALSEARRRIGEVDRAPAYMRYCALLGERMLNVYLLTHGCAVRKSLYLHEETGWMGNAGALLHLSSGDGYRRVKDRIYTALRSRWHGSSYGGR